MYTSTTNAAFLARCKPDGSAFAPRCGVILVVVANNAAPTIAAVEVAGESCNNLPCMSGASTRGTVLQPEQNIHALQYTGFT
jgi:hypothetical protein